MPDRPQHDDGIRIDPPPSDPVARGTIPEARAAALPPGGAARCVGVVPRIEVAPKTGLSVSAFHPSSGVFVLPITTHPAATRRATSGESCTGRWAAAKPASRGW